MTDHITQSLENRVLTLTINRPERKNALTQAMYGALADAINAANDDKAIRAIIITGEGDMFTAGNDLTDFASDSERSSGEPPVTRFLNGIRDAETPLIAAVNGPAVGVGLTMLLHCDLVYAARSATLSAPFVKLGLVPEAASSLLLPEAVGQAVANDIFMTGRALSADEALQFGLVARVFDDTELADGVGEIALHVANSAPNALRLTKSLVRHRGSEIAAQMEREGKLFSDQLGSPDFAESVAAMMQKRAPVYP